MSAGEVATIPIAGMRRPRHNFAILVRAGASFGAGGVTPEPPPLGDELYEWLKHQYPPTWGALAGALDARFRGNFELGMHDAWAEGSYQVQLLLIDMGRAFARFQPPTDRSDHYSTLVRAVISNRLLNRCVVASLNYDCILEEAAMRLGLPVGYTRHGRPTNGLVVLKPHGSCNLLPPSGIQLINVSMVHAGSYYEGPLEPRRLDELDHLYDSGYSMPPAISLYAPGKKTPVAQGWVDGCRQEWRAVALSAHAIAVIGVRPNWDDAHIWQPIIESRAHVWYIGGVVDYEALQQKAGRTVMHLGKTFDEGIGPLTRLLRVLT